MKRGVACALTIDILAAESKLATGAYIAISAYVVFRAVNFVFYLKSSRGFENVSRLSFCPECSNCVCVVSADLSARPLVFRACVLRTR